MKRIDIADGRVKLVPPKLEIPRPLFKPRRYVVPINQSESSSSNKVNVSPIYEVFSSEPEIGSTELYIPENKPFLPI